MATSTTNRTTTAAMTLVSCERDPEADTIALFGGLASTAKAPVSPAATLPAPTAMRSRLKSPAGAAPAPDARAVAAVCTMHTKLTVSTGATRRRSSDQDADGTPMCASPPWMAPMTAPP